jgi:hypothetical protein
MRRASSQTRRTLGRGTSRRNSSSRGHARGDRYSARAQGSDGEAHDFELVCLLARPHRASRMLRRPLLTCTVTLLFSWIRRLLGGHGSSRRHLSGWHRCTFGGRSGDRKRSMGRRRRDMRYLSDARRGRRRTRGERRQGIHWGGPPRGSGPVARRTTGDHEASAQYRRCEPEPQPRTRRQCLSGRCREQHGALTVAAEPHTDSTWRCPSEQMGGGNRIHGGEVMHALAAWAAVTTHICARHLVPGRPARIGDRNLARKLPVAHACKRASSEGQRQSVVDSGPPVTTTPDHQAWRHLVIRGHPARDYGLHGGAGERKHGKISYAKRLGRLHRVDRGAERSVASFGIARA